MNKTNLTNTSCSEKLPQVLEKMTILDLVKIINNATKLKINI